jgi:glutathione S-transferase
MLLSSPAIVLTAAVTLLAMLISLAFAIRVARARRRTGVRAPTMTGPQELEYALRIQGNTIEQIVIFLPSLWLAALYFQGWWAPVLGLVWCLGRVIYSFVYGSESRQRFPGFALTIFPTIILWILAVTGVVQAWMASSAP